MLNYKKCSKNVLTPKISKVRVNVNHLMLHIRLQAPQTLLLNQGRSSLFHNMTLPNLYRCALWCCTFKRWWHNSIKWQPKSHVPAHPFFSFLSFFFDNRWQVGHSSTSTPAWTQNNQDDSGPPHNIIVVGAWLRAIKTEPKLSILATRW